MARASLAAGGLLTAGASLQEEDLTEWYTGIGIAESISALVRGIQSGSWVDIGLGVDALRDWPIERARLCVPT